MKILQIIHFCIKKGRTSTPLFRRKKFLIGLFTLIFISIPIALLSLQSARKATAAWFDDAWLYRKAISIPSHTAVETNVYVTVPSFDATDTTKFQSDCGDLRFTKQNGELLPYYVVDCDATANIHVQFDTLPAGASTYYMYYGNPSADNGFSSADFSTAASGLGTQTLAAEEKSQGPVAYWKFDEGYGGTANDSTQNANTGSLGVGSSAPTWQTEDQCISGKCLKFDGSGDKVQTTNVNNIPSGGAARTFSAWVKTQNDGGVIVGTNAASGQKYYMQMGIDSGTWYLFTDGVNGANNITLSASERPSLNEWVHIAFVLDGSNGWSYYLNGKLTKSGTFSVAINTATPTSVTIGERLDVAGAVFDGFIDEPKIYPYARTAAQIKSDFRSRGSSKGTSVQMGASKDNLDALSNGLVGYWKMNEASWNGTAGEVIDSSGNGNNGVGVGATPPTTGAGKFGNAGSFASVSSQYVSVTSSTSLQLSDKISISSWVYWTGSGSTVEFITAKGIEHYEIHTGGGGGSNGIRWIPRSGVYIDTGASKFLSNQWNYLVAVYDSATNTGKVYVNGSDTGATQTGSGALQTDSTNFQIGRRADSSYYFNGKIDETRIYNRALSPKEVRDLYNWAPGPVGYWKMDEGSWNGTAGEVKDSSGTGNNATASCYGGGCTYPTTTSGKFGKAGSFDGSQDYIDFGNITATIDTAKPISMSMWFKPDVTITNVSAETRLVSRGSGPYLIFNTTAADGKLEWLLYDSDINMKSVKSTTTSWTANTWYHFEGTFDGTAMKIYINGVLENTFTNTFTRASSSSNLYLATRYDAAATFWDGLIDDVRIYNYARSSKQIVEDMNAGHPAPGSPVGSAVGYWKMDEGYGSTINNVGIGGTALNGSLGVGSSAPSWSNSGKFGKALSFNGSTNLVSIPVNSSLDYQNTADVSVSTWFYWSGARGGTARQYLWDNRGSGSNSGHYLIFLDEGASIKCEAVNSSGGTTTLTTILPTTNTWYHFACIFDKTNNKITAYVNGKYNNSATWVPGSTSYTSSGTKQIAQAYPSAGNYGWYGLLDEFKIYNSALTEDEIKLDYNHGSAMVMGSTSTTSAGAPDNSSAGEYCVPGSSDSCSAPVGEWKFDEKTGGYAYDSAGVGNSGSINGATWTQGKIGGGLSFDGNDYITCGSNSSVLPDVFTLEAWVKITTTAYNTLFAWSTGTPMVTLSWTSNWPLIYLGANNYRYFNNSPTNIYDMQWHHVAFVVTGNTQSDIANSKMYADGKEQTVYATTSSGAPDAKTVCRIGASGSQFFNGTMDQVKLYNYARTPAQIAYDYNRGGPVGWWKMDECQGGTANDASGNGNNGTITIGATGTQSVLGTCSIGVGSTAAWGNGSVGKYNSSLNFDGTDDWVTVGNLGSFYSQGTLSFWINASEMANYRNPLTTKYNGGNAGIRFEENASGTFGVITGNDAGTYDSAVYISSGMSTSTWYHVIYTWNTSTNWETGFLNGVQTFSNSHSLWPTTIPDLRFGTGFTTEAARQWKGQIDDVKIFNYALTATQVKTLYNSGAAVQFAPSTGSP